MVLSGKEKRHTPWDYPAELGLIEGVAIRSSISILLVSGDQRVNQMSMLICCE
jgi:hypothetical protein